MAYNTREIIRDERNNPIPQYFNETENQYQPVTGDKAPYTQIVDVNGNPISSENRLPVDAQLSGRKVIKEQVFGRSIRANESSFINATVPDGAIGLDFSVSIEGVTGSFASGEGLEIEVAFRYDDWSPTSWIHSRIRTQRTTEPGSHTILIYPGADTQKSNIEDVAPSERVLKIASIPLVQRVRFGILITGTFGQDEGFDCLGYVTWLY